MKGLVLKDIYTLTKQFKLFLIIIVIFSLLPGYSMAAFAIIYSAMMPITALAYDERSKWDKLAAMMPYSRRSIVLSKYVLGYICLSGAALLALVGKLAYSVIQKTPLGVEEYIELLIMICVAVLLQSFNLPIMFKLGVEKGRMLFLIAMGVIFAGIMFFTDQLSALAETVFVGGAMLAAAAVGVSVVINLISISCSIRMYTRREA